MKLAEQLLDMHEIEYTAFMFLDDMDTRFEDLGSQLKDFKKEYPEIVKSVDELRDRFYAEVTSQMKANDGKLGTPKKKKLMYESKRSQDDKIKKIFSNWTRNVAQLFRTKLQRGDDTKWITGKPLMKVISSFSIEGLG